MTEIELTLEKLRTSISDEDKDIISTARNEDQFEKEDWDYLQAQINGTYFPKRRNQKLVLCGDLILDFIYNYEVKNFDLFSIHFNNYEEVESNENYIFVGNYEGSEIVIEKKSKSILLLDIDGSIISKCSEDSKIFFNNLIALNFFTHQSRTLREKEEFIQKALQIPIKDDRSGFWLTLVGEWDD